MSGLELKDHPLTKALKAIDDLIGLLSPILDDTYMSCLKKNREEFAIEVAKAFLIENELRRKQNGE